MLTFAFKGLKRILDDLCIYLLVFSFILVMQVLIEESRDRFQSHDSFDNNNNIMLEQKPTTQRHKRSSSVTSNSSVESFASSRSRKTSVVQIKSRDETSDYHSDEDVFDDGECAGDEFRATICYVGSCAIKKTSRISVSDGVSELKCSTNNQSSDSRRGRSQSLKEQIVYKDLVIPNKVMK